MDSNQLSRICKNDVLINRIFRGIFSIDNIPIIEPDTAYIINLSKQNEYGSHWTVLFSSKDKKIIYFLCSLNTNPKKYSHLYSIILKTGYKLWQIGRQIQSDFSTACGPYSLFFLWLISHSYTPPEIANQFFTHHAISELFKNDILVSIIISTLFHLESASKLLMDVTFLEEQKMNDEERRKKNSKKNSKS